MSDYILDHKVQRRLKSTNSDLDDVENDENAPPLNYRCSVEIPADRKGNQKSAASTDKWNKQQMESFYSEVLSALIRVLRPKGKDTPEAAPLVAYLQQAFKIDQNSHYRLLDAVQLRKDPLVVSVEIIEAKDLRGKDANGLSDPYCKLYVSSKKTFTTAVKPATLNPIWRQHFSIPVKNYQDGTLTIEVWDYDDPEESMSDKMTKFKEVKSARGMKNFMKELAFSSSNGNETGDFMGCLKIPIKSIPAEGLEKWYTLDYFSIDFATKNGDVFLSAIVGAEKDKVVAVREYKQVLQILLAHELKDSDIKNSPWNGEFSPFADSILKQLRLQGALCPLDINLAKWYAYVRAQAIHALNAKLFPAILTQVQELLKEEEIRDNDLKTFWRASEIFVENFHAFMINNFGCLFKNLPGSTQAYHLLRSMELLKDLSASVGNRVETRVGADFLAKSANEAISAGAEGWFDNIHSSTIDSRCEVATLMKIGEALIGDLPKRLGLLDMVAKEFLGIHYFDLTYRMYDKKYGELVKALVVTLCKKMKALEARNSKDNTMGKSLFELYHLVKQFVEISDKMHSNDNLSIKDCYHGWFHASVDHWMETAWHEADQRMERAVQLDALRPISDMGDESKITSSAVDTKLIFSQILIFWGQLQWSSPEDSFAFIMKILDDFCKCTLNYHKLMTKKVEQLKRNQGNNFEIYDELCYAINNMEYVGREISQMYERLEAEKVLDRLEGIIGVGPAGNCEQALRMVLANSNGNVVHSTSKLLTKIGSQMHTVIYGLLAADIEAKPVTESKLCLYLDRNLGKICDKSLSECFDKIFPVIWENTTKALRKLTTDCVEKSLPEMYFQRMDKILETLRSLFFPDGLSDVGSAQFENPDIKEVQSLIRIHGATTGELILHYTRERLRQQGEMDIRKGENGILTFRTAYYEDTETLMVEILNCSDLKPYDSNGLNDPYVKFRIVPHERFPEIRKKTAVKKKTLFPLFDETFSFRLTRKEKSMGGVIRFAVKDYDLIGKNDFIGESFQSLESVRVSTSKTELQVLPQIRVPLSMPNAELVPMLQSLESRTWDPQALKFARKERVKTSAA